MQFYSNYSADGIFVGRYFVINKTVRARATFFAQVKLTYSHVYCAHGGWRAATNTKRVITKQTSVVCVLIAVKVQGNTGSTDLSRRAGTVFARNLEL